LKYNTCVFNEERQAINKTHRLDTDITAVTGLDHFPNFIYGCGAPGPKGLRRVVIQYEGPMTGGDLHGIFKVLADDSRLSTFCRKNPKVQVIIRFRVMITSLVNPGKHLDFTNVFSLPLRQRLAHQISPARNQASMYAKAARLPPHAVNVHLPPNLRLSTMIDEEFRAEHVRLDDMTQQYWLPNVSSA
jgi:hypothetical protein